MKISVNGIFVNYEFFKKYEDILVDNSSFENLANGINNYVLGRIDSSDSKHIKSFMKDLEKFRKSLGKV